MYAHNDIPTTSSKNKFYREYIILQSSSFPFFIVIPFEDVQKFIDGNKPLPPYSGNKFNRKTLVIENNY